MLAALHVNIQEAPWAVNSQGKVSTCVLVPCSQAAFSYRPGPSGDVQGRQLPMMSSEDSQDMAAASASGAAQATAGNNMQTALDLPPEQQVGLIMDIIKAMPDPSKHPKFLKQRRSQSKPITLSDYCRPVETPAEHSLFLHCHMLHTNPKSNRTDWGAMTREFNLAVSRNRRQTKKLADILKRLKNFILVFFS